MLPWSRCWIANGRCEGKASSTPMSVHWSGAVGRSQPPMHIVEKAEEMRGQCRAWRLSGKRLGLVPTMGALHEGHLSLLRAAALECDVVAASLFVNPLQFGPTEDLARYPRDFEGDCAKFESEGVQLLFAPPVQEMYAGPNLTLVTVEDMSDRLCGRSRPGHFRGVTTVVSKRSEEHTSELQSPNLISYAVFCLKKKKKK